MRVNSRAIETVLRYWRMLSNFGIDILIIVKAGYCPQRIWFEFTLSVGHSPRHPHVYDTLARETLLGVTATRPDDGEESPILFSMTSGNVSGNVFKQFRRLLQTWATPELISQSRNENLDVPNPEAGVAERH